VEHVVPRGAQPLEFRRATTKCELSARRQQGGERHRDVVDDRPLRTPDINRLRNALEVPGTYRYKRGLGSRTGNRTNSGTEQPLACVRGRANALRFDDHGAEQVVVLVQRVTDCDPDAQLERLSSLTVATLDTLLDRDGSRERIGGTRERHHRAIAQALHDLAVALRDRIGDNVVVLPAQRIGGAVSDAAALSRRTDEVGENDSPRPATQWHVRRRLEVVSQRRTRLYAGHSRRPERVVESLAGAASGRT